MPQRPSSPHSVGGRSYRRVDATRQNDATGTGSGSSGAPAAVAPSNSVAPVVSGTATVGQTLSTTNGTWSGTATIVFTYQWQRAGVNIGGATASTYALVDADYTNAVRCVVTGTNGAGNASANSNATAAVVRTYAQQVLADSPLVYLRLAEASGTAFADSSGNGRTYTGTATGITYGSTGAVAGNNACTFNGSSGGLHSDVAMNMAPYSALTIEFWLKPTTYFANFVLAECATGTNRSFSLLEQTGPSRLQVFSAGQQSVSFPLPATGAYHHYTIVIRTGTTTGAITARIDKVDQTITETTTNSITAFFSDTVNVMCRNFASLFAQGVLDEFAIYGSALSSARTDAHYDASAV